MKYIVTGSTGGIGSVIIDYLLRSNDANEVLGIGRNYEKTALIHSKMDIAIKNRFHSVFIPENDWKESNFNEIIYDNTFYDADCLVVAHGYQPYVVEIGQIDEEMFIDILKSDVMQSFNIAQACFYYMRRQTKGSIIFISSIHSIGTYPNRLCYSTVKSAITGMARSFALEGAKYNINCNVISPGQVHGGRTKKFWGNDPNAKKAMLDRSPAGKIVTPEDIAKTVEFLSANKAINGQNIVIDYGVSVNFWYGSFGEEQ